MLGYRAQHHVEGDFRLMKNPLYLSFRSTFHWTDQKLRVHAFYCVLALMILNLLRRQLAQAGIRVSVLAMMKQLTNIQEVTVLYPAPQRGQKLLARTMLSKMNARQQKWLPPSPSIAIGPIRSYILNSRAAVPGATPQHISPSGLVNSG